MMRSRLVAICGAVALAAVAGIALWMWRGRTVQPVRRADTAPAAALGAELSLPGKIRAQQVTAVAAPIDGVVDELRVQPGESVSEGQLLGRIKNSEIESEGESAAAELDKAQSRLSQVESDLMGARAEAARARAESNRARSESDRLERAYLRQQMLLKEGATPRLVFEKAAAEYEAAKKERDTRADAARVTDERLADLVKAHEAARGAVAEKTEARDAARESAAAAEIHAPVSGMVVGVSKRVGEEVTTDVKDLLQIAADLAALEVVVETGPAALARVRAGQEALVIVAGAGEAIAGRVKSVEGSSVVVEFTSPSAAVRPGDSAHVRIKLT